MVCGNIGVGKTTACRRLEGLIHDSEAIYEKFAENRYLPLFYKVLEEKGKGEYNEYCFPTQMVFLKSRAKREMNLTDPTKCYILDRGLLEDRYIFGQNQIDQGFMTEQEIEKYTTEFNNYLSNVAKPDVVIYLRADLDTLLQRVKSRGRDMESSIDTNYLGSLQNLYDNSLIPQIENRFKDIKLLKYQTDFTGEEDVVKKVFKDLLLLDKAGTNCHPNHSENSP